MSMNHEPECRHYVEEAASIRTGACIFCGIARAAYQRGREDAANAVESAIDYLNSMKMPTTPAWTLWESQLISGCIALARGVGLTGKASSSDLDADEIRIKDGEQA